MSEIFAPGSIAGPAGPPVNFRGAYNAGTEYAIGDAVSSGGSSYISLVASNSGNTPASSPTQWGVLAANGAAGAAGSTAAITSLASSSLPSFVGQNLFDFSKITAGLGPALADGTLVSVGSGATNATALIYCPGATSMISDLSVDAGNWGNEAICLYDANGAFISALPTSEFSTVVNGETIVGAQAWALPGTQVYVRLCYVPSWLSGNSHNWTQTEALGRIYATITGTATLPGSYAAPGLDTVADVNAKDAVVAGNAATALATALTAIPETLFASIIPGPATFNLRNAFDPNKTIAGYWVQNDGTLAAHAGGLTATVYCPGATSAISNIPIFANAAGSGNNVCTYDAQGNFIADISATFASYLSSGRITGNTTIPLPGNQTYIKFTYATSWSSSGWAASLNSAAFYSGTVALPPPSTLSGIALPPFTGNTSTQVRTASSLGATPDGFSDASPVLNAFLATASSTNPIELVLDGIFTVSSGLVISPNGYTSIRGLGVGTGIAVTSYYDGIRIGAYTSGTGDSEGAAGTAPSRAAVNIMLRDFTVNATGQVNAAANQPVSGAVAHGTYPIILANCSQVMIDNLNFPTYGANYCITLSNVDHVRVTNCTFNTTGYTHDGVHVDGPAEDIGIENCDFATGDDAIALNGPEGYGGDISRVSITNCRFKNSLSVFRIYTSYTGAGTTVGPFKVRDVVVSNCTGYVTNIAFVIGIEGGGLTPTSGVDQVQDVSISNCTLSAPVNLLRVRDYIGAVTMSGVKFIPTSTNPAFDIAYGVGEISLSDFTILRNPDGNTVIDALLTGSGSTIDKLTMRHCRVTDEEGSSYTAISSWLNNGGTVSNWRMEDVDMTHVAALTAGSSWTGISAVKGAGVVGTGVQVPDANMDNNALYLSSNDSGALSMKIGGSARRVNLT